ncbi:BTA121 domain-containing protein surface lipoprotein [Borrelia crocidurae]|uniref:Lipoprotein n=1 Tax=Borrelia crocidurae (strain Achema) TaxID=1155096 RepID=I0FED9_BORCA|nr:hypothetical protein [Borrelia crocidurae]AFI31845.1 hypothetical protein Q7M_1137 [Borrelia crocidurae str. Achema]
MVKGMKFNLLLLLFVSVMIILVLTIGCNLKSPRQDVVLSKKSFEKVFLSRELEEVNIPLQRNIDFALYDKQLNELLDTFEMDESEKEFVFYIKEAVTSSDMASDTDKIWSQDDFRDILKNLGVVNVRKLIGPKSNFNALSRVRAAIKSVKSIYALEKLRSQLGNYERAYFIDLRKAFNAFVDDDKKRYDNSIVGDYTFNFDSLDKEARYIVIFESCYGELPSERQIIIDKMRKILTDTDIGRAEGFSTYDNYEFDVLFGKLGSTTIKDIVEIFLKNLQIIETARMQIDDIYMSDRKDILERKLAAYKAIYHLTIKKVFNSDIVDDIYAKFKSMSITDPDSNFTFGVYDLFYSLNNCAFYINAYNSVYRFCSPQHCKAIDYLKGILTQSDGTDSYKRYEVYEFEALFGNANFDFKSILDAHIDTLKKRDEARGFIEGIRDASKKEAEQKDFDVLVRNYPEYLRKLFHNFDPIYILVKNINHNYAERFVNLKSNITHLEFVKKMQEKLSVKEYAMFMEISAIITNPNIAVAEGYRTYKVYEVNGLFDDDRFESVKSINMHLQFSDLQKEVASEINGIADEDQKQYFKNQLDKLVLEYQVHLKGLFHMINADNIPPVLKIDISFVSRLNNMLDKIKRMFPKN